MWLFVHLQMKATTPPEAVDQPTLVVIMKVLFLLQLQVGTMMLWLMTTHMLQEQPQEVPVDRS